MGYLARVILAATALVLVSAVGYWVLAEDVSRPSSAAHTATPTPVKVASAVPTSKVVRPTPTPIPPTPTPKGRSVSGRRDLSQVYRSSANRAYARARARHRESRMPKVPPTPTPRPTPTALPTPTPTRVPPTPTPTPLPPTPTPTPTPTQDDFVAYVGRIDAATRNRMRYSWRPGCPVPLEDLRLVTVRYWGFDGRPHMGELVIHERYAYAIVQVMHELYDAKFPIERMQLVDVYGGDDDRSMAANNTSAFNCRAVTGRPGVWSEHSYGRAIDINPVQNPYVTASGVVLPPAGQRYLDRTQALPGMIKPGDVVVRSFERIGWRWGGYWSDPKDYQHFSATGR